MSIIQIKIEDELREKSDRLFASYGISTGDAIRIFLEKTVEGDSYPFGVAEGRKEEI